MIKKIEKLKNNPYLFWILVVGTGIWFFFLLGEDGYCLWKDSGAFIEAPAWVMQSYKLYPYFIKGCRMVFGQGQYLTAIFLIQATFALLVSVFVMWDLKRYYQLKNAMAYTIFLCILLPYGYSLPQQVVTHQILTEAVAIPFFYLFMLFAWKTFTQHRLIHMIWVLIFTVLLALTRSQLMLMAVVYVALWILIGLSILYQKIHKSKRVTFWVCIFALSVITVAAGLYIFSALIQTSFISQLSSAVSGRVLCAADKQDASLFLNEEDRQIFEITYQKVEEGKYRYPYFRNDLKRWDDISIASKENAKLVQEAVAEYYGKSQEELGSIVNEHNAVLASTLFRVHAWDYASMTLSLLPQSFLASIFIQPDAIYTLCYVVTLFLYIGAIGLLITGRFVFHIEERYCIPLELTFVALVINVLATNLIFCGIQRYMIYPFGCFYLSLVLLLTGMYRNKNFTTRIRLRKGG